MAEARKWRVWAKRLSWLAAILVFGGIAAAMIGALGSGREYWDFRVGFKFLRWAFYAVAAGGILAIAAALVGRRRAVPRLILLNLLTAAIALVYCLYMANMYRSARAAVAIHDVTTNVDEYPRFYRLTVREDNLAAIPDLGRRDLAALPPRERWKAVHRIAYPELQTVRVQGDVDDVVRRAEALARERGWELVTVDPREGVVEAVDTSRWFRFKDNVIVRVRPLSDQAGVSMVDMRSISRVGVSDTGTNARRIRDFLEDLRGGG
jgi:hypothetical protein